MAAKIIKCRCPHEFQDARYGKSLRVHNSMKKDSTGRTRYRCTVCGNETAPAAPTQAA